MKPLHNTNEKYPYLGEEGRANIPSLAHTLTA